MKSKVAKATKAKSGNTKDSKSGAKVTLRKKSKARFTIKNESAVNTENKNKKKVKIGIKKKHEETQKKSEEIDESKTRDEVTEENVNNENEKSVDVAKPNLKRKHSSGKEGIEDKKKNTRSALRKKASAKKVDSSDEAQETEEETESSDNTSLKDLSRKHIMQCITAIFHLTQEQLKNKNELFSSESHPIFMQVTCIRVPKVPKRQMRILLPHSIVSSDDEVALFVCDLQRGRRRDYEPTVEHYEELLRKHGCDRVNAILPMNQVKTEYDQFELKRKLVNSYDYFLVDGRIAGHMSHLLGKHFSKKRKVPTSIKMESKDLKHEIEYALRKTCMQLHGFGDTHVVQIGHTFMKKQEILENILAVCENLSKNYPGGWENIRSLRIKTATSLSVPIYVTLKNKNTVPVPVVKPKRPRAYRTVTGELSTIPGVEVAVTPEGHVIVKKTPNSEDEEEETE